MESGWNWIFNLEVVTTRLAYDLDVGVEGRLIEGIQDKASFGDLCNYVLGGTIY